MLLDHVATGMFELYVIDGRCRWAYRPFVSFYRRPDWLDDDDTTDDED